MGDEGSGDGGPDLGGQALEADLVVQPGELSETAGVEGRQLRELVVAGGEVERLLEAGHDHVDAVPADDVGDIGDEA